MHPCATLLGGDTWRPAPGVSWTLSHVLFPLLMPICSLSLLQIVTMSTAGFLSFLSPLGGSPSLRVVLGNPQHSLTLTSNLTVRLKEGKLCHVPGAYLRVPHSCSGICRDPPSPHMSSPFPQVVEHSVVPSCFQL